MAENEARLTLLQQQFVDMIEGIDRVHLRKMQAEMHKCAANCYESQSYSMRTNQNCIQKCSAAVENAQQYVELEFNRLQNRWGRCVMECNDKMQDALASSSAPALNSNACLSGCIETQHNLIRIAEESMGKVLAGGKYNNV